MIDSNKNFFSEFLSSENNFFVTHEKINFVKNILKTIIELY